MAARARRSCEKQKGQRVRRGRPQRELGPPFMVVFANDSDVLFCSLVQAGVARLPACKKNAGAMAGRAPRASLFESDPVRFPRAGVRKTGTRTTRTVSLLRGVDDRRLR